MEYFSERLLVLMEQQGLTQRELSQASGVSQGTISKHVNGKQLPKSKELYAISKVLGVAMESWFEDEPQIKNSKPKILSHELNDKIKQLKENAADASSSVERLLVAIKKLEGAL